MDRNVTELSDWILDIVEHHEVDFHADILGLLAQKTRKTLGESEACDTLFFPLFFVFFHE